MKVYPLNDGVVAIVDPETGERYEGDANNGLDVPEHLGNHLLGTHIDGKPAYESDATRSVRLVVEAEEKDRDPKTLLEEVRKLREAQESSGKEDDEDEDPKPVKKAAAKKAPAKKAAAAPKAGTES